MEEQATSAGDQSDKAPAPNAKASRARLWRARRKHGLSVEQLEDARKKNRYHWYTCVTIILSICTLAHCQYVTSFPSSFDSLQEKLFR